MQLCDGMNNAMDQSLATPVMASLDSGRKPCSVLVLGEALIDLFADGPQPGGAPFNVARSLAALQVPVTCVTRLGHGDAGADLVRQSALRFGLSLHGFQTDSLHPTGSVQVMQEGGGHRFSIGADAAWDYLDLDQARAVADSIAAPAFVYFGTLAQRHRVSRTAIRALVQSSNAIRYLDLNLRDDPDSRRLAQESLELADWVKVNDHELMQLLIWSGGEDLRSQAWGAPLIDQEIVKLMARFHLQRLVVTRGALGYACYGASGDCEALGLGVALDQIVDTVGAGDGFSAMLMAGYVNGHGIADCLSMANRYAAGICRHRGPVADGMQAYSIWRQQLVANQPVAHY
jgi:fructokinase